MRKYFTILYQPEGTFLELIEADDVQHGKRTNTIIFLTVLTPLVFALIYDFLIPFDPNSTDAPLSMRIIGFIFPIVFGTILGVGIFKYLIPFLIFRIGLGISSQVENIAQTRFVVAFSLIPILIISPLRGIYFIENQTIIYIINILLALATVNSVFILFTGIKLIYKVENVQTLLIISPYILLIIIGYFMLL